MTSPNPDKAGLEAAAKDELRARMRSIVSVVLPFASKAKARMQTLGKRRVRIKCPLHETPADQGPYVHCILAGPRDHIHMGCEDAACIMRVME